MRAKRVVVRTIASCLLGGGLGVGLVFAGMWLMIPGFCPRTGYWAAHFLDSTLYSMGDDAGAMTVVAALYFVYGAAIFGIANALLLARRLGPGASARPE